MTPCSNSAAALAATASRVRMGRVTRLASSVSTLKNARGPSTSVTRRLVGGCRDGSNGGDGSGIGDGITGANRSGHGGAATIHQNSGRRRHGFTGIFDPPRMVAGSSSGSMARFSSGGGGGGGGGGTSPAADEEEDDLTEEERQSIFTSLQKEPSLASSQAAERMRVREKHLKEHKFYVAERTKMLGGVNGEVPDEDEEEEMQELTAPIEPEPLRPKSGMQTGLAAAAAAAGTSRHEGDKSPPTPKKSAGEEKTKPQKRRRIRDVTIAEVLRTKHTLRWVEPVISRSATVREAVVVCIEGGLSGMMVIDYSHVPHSPAAADDREEDDDDDSIPVTHTNPSAAVVPNDDAAQQHPGRRGRVVGMITSRDLLRIMAAGFQADMDAQAVLSQRVGEFMTPISQVIYARPDETIGMCRTVMAKLGVKCLPILSNGQRVEGLITARDLSEFGLEVTDRGGKKNFLKDVSERVGLSSNTSMADPPAYLRAHLALEQKPLFVNVGIAELPHPFKTVDGIGMNKRDHGPRDWSTDVDLSEDAHFAVRVTLPDESGVKNRFRDVCYMGVADGVGSWREYGVDPRDFSHRLMEECRNILLEASASMGIGMNGLDASGGSGGSGGGTGTTAVPVVPSVGGGKFRRSIAPAEVLAQAYDRVKGDDVVGSCTACVAMFDGVRHQLHFSNLGDSGIIVLRHIDSDVAGSLKRDRQKKREERESDLRVAFVSQQQLRSFNHPYQLGWVGEELAEGDSVSFKTAADSCTSSVHVRRGDIVILATDGLFDNVDIDDIAEIALQWEQENGFVRGGDVTARAKRWEKDNSMTKLSEQVIPDLAEVLCQTAREKSLDDNTDGPFAILAKENDIMWSGGMPDDCTVVAIHVVGKDPHEVDGVPE